MSQVASNWPYLDYVFSAPLVGQERPRSAVSKSEDIRHGKDAIALPTHKT